MCSTGTEGTRTNVNAQYKYVPIAFITNMIALTVLTN